jgi:hypothetical protein
MTWPAASKCHISHSDSANSLPVGGNGPSGPSCVPLTVNVDTTVPPASR